MELRLKLLLPAVIFCRRRFPPCSSCSQYVLEELYEHANQEICVLLQTISKVVFCRHGLCLNCIANCTGAPIICKLHYEEHPGKQHAGCAWPDLSNGWPDAFVDACSHSL